MKLFSKLSIFFLIILFGSIIFCSCNKNKYLNPKPTVLLTSEVAFASKERVLSQVNGLYSEMKEGRFLGSWYYLASDIRAGDFVSTNLNAGTGAITYQMNTLTTTDDVVFTWRSIYQVINACNVFIEGLEKTEESVLSNSLKSNYLGEARMLRAISYYDLLQLYAKPYRDNLGTNPGLPLRLKGNTNPGNYDLARSSVKEVYEQIISDLDYAELNLPESYNTSLLNTTRVHRNSAIAFKTRVYLSMQDYDNVINEGNKIVSISPPFSATSGVRHELSKSIGDVFSEPYTSSESIFSMPFTSSDPPATQRQLGYNYLPGISDGGSSVSNGLGEYSLYPNRIISDSYFSVTDERRGFIKFGTQSGKPWLFKFKKASPFTDYVPVIRYSEILLNLAEAITRKSLTINERAVELLSIVHNRSDKNTVIKMDDFSNSEELIQYILKERHMEFLGEGLRNIDIMRLGLPIPEKPFHGIPSVQPSDPNYIYPISIEELNLNKLMVNN